jgi:hypothetical protein
MAVRLDKPWIPLTEEHVARVTGHLGVYELANASEEIVYIGVAGGRALFGLKGALMDVLPVPPAGASLFRYEVNMAYHSRYRELLQAYYSDHGCLPVGNDNVDVRSLGRLRLG